MVKLVTVESPDMHITLKTQEQITLPQRGLPGHHLGQAWWMVLCCVPTGTASVFLIKHS